MRSILLDPNLPLGRIQIRYRGQVIAEFDCDPNDSAEILRRQHEAVEQWKREQATPDAAERGEEDQG